MIEEKMFGAIFFHFLQFISGIKFKWSVRVKIIYI